MVLEELLNQPIQYKAGREKFLQGRFSTVLREEIVKFLAVSNSWWDQDGQFKMLHQLNPARIQYVRDKLTAHFQCNFISSRPFCGLSVLDIGCGGGLFSEPMARLGCSVTGIDALKQNILIAQMHASQVNLTINYRYTTVTQLSAEGATFNVVLALEVLEHIENQPLFLATASTLVAPNGIMIISTLNRTLQSLLFAKMSAEYILHLLPKETHDWRKFVRPSELVCWVQQGNSLNVIEMKGVKYIPILKKWLLSEDLSINYFTIAKRI